MTTPSVTTRTGSQQAVIARRPSPWAYIAGDKRRKDIAALRRSTNLMLEAFAEKPIDVPKLKEIAAQVRQDAFRVLT